MLSFTCAPHQALAKIPEGKMTLVHADLFLLNLLFNRVSHRPTAVLDLDFAHIGAPVPELLFSFWDLDGLLPGSAEPLGPLRKDTLGGFPERHKRIDAKWKLAREWDTALAEVGAKRPSTIPNAGDVADIWWFSQGSCQASWFMDLLLEKRTPKMLEKFKMTVQGIWRCI